MRSINVEEIQKTIEAMCTEACRELPVDVKVAIDKAYQNETMPLAKFLLNQIKDNARIAKDEQWPICQDTGMVVVFMDIGQQVFFCGGSLNEAIEKGIADAYQKGGFRNSIVKHPFLRENTGNNLPAVIHYAIVEGDRVGISVAPKGFGSENMSKSYMLNPTAAIQGVKEVIVQTVKEAGGNPCPPVVVGVGLGGTLDKAAILAKKALLRPLGKVHQDPIIAGLEAETLLDLNRLGIGPLGIGGKCTALGVHVEFYPTHIAGLPVVVNLQCHAARHRVRVI